MPASESRVKEIRKHLKDGAISSNSATPATESEIRNQNFESNTGMAKCTIIHVSFFFFSAYPQLARPER